MKYIFIGGTYRGFKVLESLINIGEKPDYCFFLKEDEHEENKYSTKLSELAKSKNIPFIVKKKICESDYPIFQESDRDFAIVCGWRTLIDNKFSKNFKLGILVAHDSLLPKYRGFAPLNWCIINGEKTTGVTLFKINDEVVDSGEILGQNTVYISPTDYAIDVYEKITEATVNLVKGFVIGYEKGKFSFTKQNDLEATYTCKRMPEDGKIDWNKSSKEVYNLIRGLAHPYPGAFVYYNNEEYRIRRAELGESNDYLYTGNIPGRIIKISDKGVEVLCNKGTILITEWEPKKSNIIENPNMRIKLYATTL